MNSRLFRTVGQLAAFAAAGVSITVAVAWSCSFRDRPREALMSIEIPANTKCLRKVYLMDRPGLLVCEALLHDPENEIRVNGFSFAPRWIAARRPVHELVPPWAKEPLLSPDIVAVLKQGSRSHRQVDARGWPMPALWSFTCFTLGDASVTINGGIPLRAVRPARDGWAANPPRILPLRPLFPGFFLNTAFYATLLFTLFTTPPILRRHLRRRRNHCPHCNYDLRGLTTCPECGP